MQIISLDISNRQIPTVVNAKQGDVGRKFKVVLTDNGDPYLIPKDAGLTLWYNGTSGEGNYSSVGENSAFTIEGNTVEVELLTQMLACRGGGTLCLVLHDTDGSQIGMWNLPYIVEAVPGIDSEEATIHYTALAQTAQMAIEAAATFSTDSDLTQEGKAADAKAVGDALTAKAPAGYGLGTEIIADCSRVADLNDPNLKTGFYSCTASTENVPDDGFGGGPLYVVNWLDGQILLQHLWNNDLSEVYLRRFKDGVWSEWEYVDPAMTAGVVYRTTQKHNGKPVYAVYLNFGTLPNATTIYEAIGISVADYPNVKLVDMDFVAKWNNCQYVNPCLLGDIPIESFLYNNGSAWYFAVKSTGDLSSGTGRVTLKFTKE